MHFSCSQNQSVAKLPLIQLQCLLNGFIGDSDTGISRQKNKIDAHFRCFSGIFQCGLSAAGHSPHIFLRVFRGKDLLHRFQIDADRAAGQFL